MFWPPLSGPHPCTATFPHEFEWSGWPPVPKPILESQLWQLFCSLARIPIRALGCWAPKAVQNALNPSRLQFDCSEALEGSSDFHLSRFSEVWRYFPSAIREYKEEAVMLMAMKLTLLPLFIPRQILLNFVSQYVGNIVSWPSNPVEPAKGLYTSLLDQINWL